MENYKTLKKEIEEDINRGKHILCSWIGINITKTSTLPKAIYRFNTTLMKIPMIVFHRTRTNISKIYMEPQRPHTATAILRKKNKVGLIMLPNMKLYYKAIVIKTA